MPNVPSPRWVRSPCRARRRRAAGCRRGRAPPRTPRAPLTDGPPPPSPLRSVTPVTVSPPSTSAVSSGSGAVPICRRFVEYVTTPVGAYSLTRIVSSLSTSRVESIEGIEPRRRHARLEVGGPHPCLQQRVCDERRVDRGVSLGLRDRVAAREVDHRRRPEAERDHGPGDEPGHEARWARADRAATPGQLPPNRRHGHLLRSSASRRRP